MKHVICLISIIALALLISPAFATLSLNGPTGTANLPNAEIAKGGLCVSFDKVDSLGYGFRTRKGPDSVDADSWRAAYGIGKKLELSAFYLGTWRPTKGVAAKFALNSTDSSKNAIGLVYGTVDPIDEWDDRFNAVQGYFAHTRTLVAEDYKRPAILGTIGVNYTDMTWMDGVVREFASVEMRYMNNSLALDYQTKNSTIEGDAMWSIALRRTFQSGLGLQLGWTNGAAGVAGNSSARFFFGGSFAYGMK